MKSQNATLVAAAILAVCLLGIRNVRAIHEANPRLT